MATESYVNVSTGYAAGYSGLLMHVMSKHVTDNNISQLRSRGTISIPDLALVCCNAQIMEERFLI